MNQKDARKAEAAEFQAKVKAAIDEAHTAAASAFAAFRTTAELTPEGHIADACGSALVIVRKPSYQFRAALKALGEIDYGSNRGAWEVSDFSRSVDSQSISANETACNAAVMVLNRTLGEHGEFRVQSRVD